MRLSPPVRTTAVTVVLVAVAVAGVAPELRERIFDPFFTTKRRGTGLGLAICRQIVVEHGGALTADSSAGRGAVFRIELPLARPGAPPDSRQQAVP